MNRADNNLEPTIELDGQQYNITAVDALWADVARKVENVLTINESKLKSGVEITDATEINENVQTLNPIKYDGSEDKQVSVVSSDGGVFTGPIYIPDILAPNEDLDNNISANKKAAVNLNSLETLISAIKGFPILKWNGEELNEDGDNSGAIEPFKVILYSSDKEATIGNIPSKYYFLLINTDTGYLRLGRPKSGTGSQYTGLGVLYAKHTDQLGAETGKDGTDYYTFSKLQKLIEALQKADEDEAEARENADDALEVLINQNEASISNNTASIDKINADLVALGALSNIYGYAGTYGDGLTSRKNIFCGSGDPNKDKGSIGDIYIKL